MAESIEARDLKYIWHPCAQMKDYEELPPMVIDRGKGVWLYDVHGKRYLDIVGSWWCNLLGHCNETINAAVKAQIDKLEHVIFANFSHEPAIELAETLAKIVPPGLVKFHFSDNGSASVECALKMAFQYQLQTGHGERQRFMCLSEGYHGETIGALSVGSMDLFAKLYQPMMMDNIHIDAPDCYRCPYGRCRGNCAIECMAAAEKSFAEHGTETAALIVEPLLQGSAGMRMYPPEYLAGLRRLCDSYGVLLICDEIATGFGRTGTMFASAQAGITPDIMCVSKGLTGGYLPMSITITTQQVYDAFYADYSEGKAFMHSHTYSGNPLGCAAALAVQHIFQTEPVLENAGRMSAWLTGRLQEELGEHPNVGELRHIGLIHAIELVEDRGSKRAFAAEKRLGYEIYKRALQKGLVLRPLGDVLYFNPALTIEKEELEMAVRITREAIEEVLGR